MARCHHRQIELAWSEWHIECNSSTPPPPPRWPAVSLYNLTHVAHPDWRCSSLKPLPPRIAAGRGRPWTREPRSIIGVKKGMMSVQSDWSVSSQKWVMPSGYKMNITYSSEGFDIHLISHVPSSSTAMSLVSAVPHYRVPRAILSTVLTCPDLGAYRSFWYQECYELF